MALCREQDVAAYVAAHFTEDYFLDEEEVELFAKCQDFVSKYHKLPTLQTLEEIFGTLPECPEPPPFYCDLTTERFVHRTLNSGLYECSGFVKSQELEKAILRLKEVLNIVTAAIYRQTMVEFAEDAHALIQEAYTAKLLGTDGGAILTGWETLDHMSGGIGAGDIVSIVGRPATGKSWNSLYIAHNIWWEQERSVLFVSMEMDTLSLTQRLAAMHTHLSISSLKAASLENAHQAHLASSLVAIKDHPSKLWIVDGNLTSTPTDIFSLASHLNPDIVIVDGAYLMRHENPKLDRFTRVADNVEQVKRGASSLKMPVICSWQFNREGTKKKKGKDYEVGIEHIAYSDAIGQVSSIILGLLQTDSVETLQAREIQILKMREGPIGAFKIRWDFKSMDFTEIPLTEGETVQFEQLSHT